MKSVQKRMEQGEVFTFDEWEVLVNEEIDHAVARYKEATPHVGHMALLKYRAGLFRNALRIRNALRPHPTTK